MSLQEKLDNLKLFNEKAAKLERSDLLRQIIHSGTNIKITFSKDEPSRIEAQLPTEGAVDAFMNNYRFFCQDNEGSSLANIQRTYEELPISIEKKRKFTDVRNRLNNYLETPPSINFILNENRITRRQILDTIMYGMIVHSNRTKRELIQRWRRIPFLFPMLCMEFTAILIDLLNEISCVRRLNIEVINELADK